MKKVIVAFKDPDEPVQVFNDVPDPEITPHFFVVRSSRPGMSKAFNIETISWIETVEGKKPE